MSVRRPSKPWRVRLFSSDGSIPSVADFRSSKAAYDHVTIHRLRAERGEGPVNAVRVLQWGDGRWYLYEKISFPAL